MDIQFYHANNHFQVEGLKSYTVAVRLPSKAEFSKLISNPFRTITLDIGGAICSKKDNFEYKKGREISTSKLSPVTLTLTRIIFEDTKSYFRFKDVNNVDIQIDIRMNEKSERLHLITAFVSGIFG